MQSRRPAVSNGSDSREAEIIIPLPPDARSRPVTAVRGSLILTSLRMLRALGLYSRYEIHLREHRDRVLSAVASEWLPMEVAVAHYRACDAARFSSEEMSKIAREAADRVQGPFLRTMVHLATAAGVTPWIGLRQFDRIMARTHRGGAVGVRRLGPAEVQVDFMGTVLAPIAYYREGFRLMLTQGAEIFAAKARVTLIEGRCSATTVSFHGAWT